MTQITVDKLRQARGYSAEVVSTAAVTLQRNNAVSLQELTDAVEESVPELNVPEADIEGLASFLRRQPALIEEFSH